MTGPALTYVACSCGELIGLYEATCPHCGAPHTRVLTPASPASAPVPPAVSGAGHGVAGPSDDAFGEVGADHQVPRSGGTPDTPLCQRDDARGVIPGAVENRGRLTAAERKCAMPVGLDRDAEIYEDLRGIDPDCPLFLEDEHHRCLRNTGELVRFGETCFYGANRAARRAS